MVQHFLREHLKPSEVPFMCDQCPFRAHTRQVMVDHRRDEHQAHQGEDLDQICYGTLRHIRGRKSSSCCQYCTGLRQRTRGKGGLMVAGELEVVVGLPRKRDTVNAEARGGPKSPCPSVPAW